MEHSIALVTGTTSGLGHAAARLLAIEGYRQVIITGRSLGRVQETAAELAAETKARVFTPLELDLDTPSSVQSALAALVKQGRLIDFCCSMPGWFPEERRAHFRRVSRGSQAPLIGHHQLTVGLFRANLLSPNARICDRGAELRPEGTYSMFSLPTWRSRSWAFQGGLNGFSLLEVPWCATGRT